MKVTERQPTFKARNSVFNAKATNVSLAVFPYQIEFTTNLEYTSAFYFEKDLQIIGNVAINYQQNHNKNTLTLRNIENLIKFRIYTFHNLNYKWSHYRIYETGEEEFIDSASIDLKAYLGQLVPLSNISSFRSHQSYMLPCNIERELKVKLEKTGVVINFLLLICEDEKQLEEAVRDKFFGRIQMKKIERVQQPMQQREENCNGVKAVEIEEQDKVQHKNNINGSKEGYLVDLDDLILNNNENQAANKEFQQMKRVQTEQDDLCFGVQKPKAQKIDKEQDIVVTNPQKQEKKTNVRDYSLLKLESDQGRIKMDPIDRKLELEQLEVIQEQQGFNTSLRAQQTANQEQFKQPINLSLKTDSISTKLSSVVTFSRENKIKISIILAIFLITLIVLFAFPRQLQPKKKGKMNKASKK